jgi:hypothetical protein
MRSAVSPGTVIAGFRVVTGRNIYTVNADVSGLTQVTHGGDDRVPDWGTHPFAH